MCKNGCCGCIMWSFRSHSSLSLMRYSMLRMPLRLVYGAYPDVVCHPGEEKTILAPLADSYLYKDVLQWERIKKPEKLLKLLQALAYQMGSEVSYNELAQIVGLDKETISNYITLLEQAQVIFRLGSFSRNLRNELKFARKVYFYDNGIRNALINNFADIEMRQDVGTLWENYLISERLKRNQYSGLYANTYFWRTTQMQEIDYIEEYDGRMYAFEFKVKPDFPQSLSRCGDTDYYQRQLYGFSTIAWCKFSYAIRLLFGVRVLGLG